MSEEVCCVNADEVIGLQLRVFLMIVSGFALWLCVRINSVMNSEADSIRIIQIVSVLTFVIMINPIITKMFNLNDK